MAKSNFDNTRTKVFITNKTYLLNITKSLKYQQKNLVN